MFLLTICSYFRVAAGLGPLQGGGLSRGLTDVSAGIKRIIDRIGEHCRMLLQWLVHTLALLLCLC
jgi:hypothetical protein